MKRTNDLWYSFSNLETYKKCPRAFKYIYVDREPTLENEYSKQGSEIHNFLEHIMKKAIETKSFSIEHDFASKYPEILQNFLDIESKRMSHFEDKNLYYENELEQKIYDEELHLVAKLDRVYYLFDKNNGKCLLDYKTGKVKELKDNYPQLAQYTYMYNKKFPLNTIRFWEIDYIKEKDKYYIEPINDNLIKDRMEEVKDIISNIEKDDKYECKLSPLCLWCSVLHICPMQQQAINRFKATAEKHSLDLTKQIKEAMEYRKLVKGEDKPVNNKEFIIYSKLVGSTFTDYDLLQITEGDILDLKREKDNKYDPNAIAVYHNHSKIGYIKKELAYDLHIAIDNGFDVVCNAENITGKDKGNIGVNIRIIINKR